MSPDMKLADANLDFESEQLELAREIGPKLEVESEVGRESSEIAPGTAELLKSSGMFNTFVPGALGGPELSYIQALRVLEELGRADGPSGWVVMAVGGHAGLFGGLLPDEGVEELWAENQPPLIAGMPAPRGRAERVEGGYNFEGKHQFASGSSLATHFTAGAALFEDGEPVLTDDGSPECIAIVAPDRDVRRMGNWEVTGMEATASIDYEIGPLFVPDRFVVSVNPWPAEQYRGSDAWRIAPPAIGPTGHTPVALGMARRSMEEIAALAPARKRRDAMFPTVADQPTFRAQLASLDIELRAITMYFYARANRNEMIVAEQGGPLPDPDLRHTHQTLRHAHDVAIRCVDFAYEWSGSAGLRRGHAIGRNFLDMHAINQHVVIDRNILVEAADVVIANLTT